MVMGYGARRLTDIGRVVLLTNLTAKELRAILHYDPASGVLVWRKSNKVAGYLICNRRRISINNQGYLASRLAWLYMTGEWPTALVDHKDTDSGNDRWENLRLADYSENGANRKTGCTNKSGFKGVYAFRGKWRAQIKRKGKIKCLGYFDDIDAAANAYRIAAESSFGEFARLDPR